jgi:hypothetical protein
MVLASLPLAIPPANVAIFSQETSSSVGVRGASSNAQQFNLKSQGASTGLWRQELPYGSREAVGMVGLHLPERWKWWECECWDDGNRDGGGGW